MSLRVQKVERILACTLFLCLGAGERASAQQFLPIGDTAILFGRKAAGRLANIAVVPGSTTKFFVGASDGGVWGTANGGATWSTSTDGHSSLRITAIDVDAAGMRVFAATSKPVRLLRSTDGGASFTELVVPDLAFGGDKVWRILVDPAHANTVYLNTTRGLLRSTDDGNSWTVVFPPDTSFVHDAAILSSGGSFWVLATRGGLLYRSPSGDSGSFSLINLPAPTDGQPPFFGTPRVFLAPVPGTSSHVYMAYQGSDEAIYLSTAFGAAPGFVSRHPRALRESTFVASADGSTLYDGELSSGNASVNRGTNGGLNWDIPFGGPYHPDVWALKTTASPPYLYVATDGGLWRMDESANPPTWENLNGNLGTTLLREVYTSRGNKNAIVGGTQDNGPVIYRGSGWVRGGGGDAGEAFLLRNNANIGGIYEVISGAGMQYITGDVALHQAHDDPNCSRPTGGGDFSVDPANPLMVCTATSGKIVCGSGGRDPWCMKSADIDARRFIIIDSSHAWATTSDGHVLRTSTGVLGSWQDVTNNLPPGDIDDIDAPEFGDPLRALVLFHSSTDPPWVYETTNGGACWIRRGVPPVANPGGFPSECAAPPCPNGPELGLEPLSFAVTFPGVAWSEAWYVGTDAGLLESGDSGATWHQVNFPRVEVRAIDTYRNIVAVGTWGRGVWRRVYQDVMDVKILAAYNDSPFLGHDPVGPIWSSELIDISGGLIEEVRLLADGGRVFRDGSTPFGPHDFQINPGSPFLVRAPSGATVEFVGPPRTSQPVALQPGWNAVGFVDSSLGLASEVIADAQLQGIALGAVLDGSAAVGYLPPAGEELGGSTDFPIEIASGYWVYACGAGGLWTPGAAAGTSAAPERASPAITTGSTEGVLCPDLTEILARLPDHLAARFPGEILACEPKQDVSAGPETITICDTPPPLTTDLRIDNVACAGQPGSLGCAVTVRIVGVTPVAPDVVDLSFEVEANGTATRSDGTTCPVNAQVSDAVLTVQIGVNVVPPLVDLSLVDASAAALGLVQTGCGVDEDAAIAAILAPTAEAALAQEVDLRLSGIGPVCSPDFALPNMDGDAAVDCDDGCPADAAKVDPGLCGCGIVDDTDGDGVAICLGDCDDTDGSVWSRPGEVPLLTVTHDATTDQTTVNWTPPAEPGATLVAYDTLGAFVADGFLTGGICIESDDDSDTTAVTAITPDPGEALYILVRAENLCPSVGTGSLGLGPDGSERQGLDCP